MGAKDVLLGKLLGGSARLSAAHVRETIELLVARGVQRRASDIHIEPHKQFVQVRYRIDGALHSAYKLPVTAAETIVAQTKALADLDVEERSAPQYGLYISEVDGQQIHVRVTTMPVVGGEKIVLHLMPAQRSAALLEELGFWGDNLTALRQAVARPHGLLLVTGPRHAGIDKTLTSLVALLNRPVVSIATLEETILYELPGVAQSEVTPGVPIADSLQALLRQDPNVVMATDLPDSRSLQVAAHAGSSQLMLGGMHSLSSARAIAHLQSAGIEPFELTNVLRAVISQRQVRRLCPKCRVQRAIDAATAAELEKTFGITTAGARQQLHRLEREAQQAGLGGSQPLSTSAHRIMHIWEAADGGCEACDRRGYQGQLIVAEVLVPGARLEHALLLRATPAELETAAQKDGLVSYRTDALIKMLRGQIALSEALHT